MATSESPSTVECDGGGEVYVIADGSDVIITGDCTEIDLLGSGNTVEIASSLELDVYGNDNQVGAEDVREVDVYGNGNTVTIGAVSEIDVEGSNNVITFATGNPSIDDDGTGNSVTSA